jgi:membrane protein
MGQQAIHEMHLTRDGFGCDFSMVFRRESDLTQKRSVWQYVQRLLEWKAWLRIYNCVDQKHTWQMAAALAYYSVLSLFPALILLSAALASLPGNAVFDQSLNALTRLLPPESVRLVRNVIASVITPARDAYFSFGFLGTIWAASAGFSASIEALNVAYGVKEDRPFWKTRALGILLALLSGTLLLIALSVIILGPRFGNWLAARFAVPSSFSFLWPFIHWIIAVSFTILGIEFLYLLAPCGKRTFRATLPGAGLAVGCWLALSGLLGIYFRHVGSFDKTYGALAAAIALLIWMYWAGFSVLLGAELNAELAQEERPAWPQFEDPPSSTNLAA